MARAGAQAAAKEATGVRRMSAFGAKRTCRDGRKCFGLTRMTQLGHERAAFAAMHRPDLLYLVCKSLALGYAP
jgi:hypothetical protein